VLDCSGINDIDATGVDALGEAVAELDAGPVDLHLCDVKGPVRDALRRSGLWARLDGRVHATAHQAVLSLRDDHDRPASLRRAGIDERDSRPTETGRA
jgi:SulP family sulfate permease